MNSRLGIRCTSCGSLERTRALKFVLDRISAVQADSKVLHFAPEVCVSQYLQNICGAGYDCADFSSELYGHVRAKKFDLTKDCDALPSDHYDLIIHIHVLEPIPIKLTYVFHHLHRSLKKDGKHVFAVPIFGGRWDETFDDIGSDEAVRRFRQFDRVRLFGAKDIQRHLGALIRIKDNYSLYDYGNKKDIEEANIPIDGHTGFNSTTIFVAEKDDYKLWL